VVGAGVIGSGVDGSGVDGSGVEGSGVGQGTAEPKVDPSQYLYIDPLERYAGPIVSVHDVLE
jgi:hypothetical protein